jgi:hypothetical protein
MYLVVRDMLARLNELVKRTATLFSMHTSVYPILIVQFKAISPVNITGA